MTVTVYSQPSCVQCNAVYRALTSKKVEFQVVDVSKDDAARERLKSLGYSQVPVTEVGEDHWYGYVPNRINELASKLAAQAA